MSADSGRMGHNPGSVDEALRLRALAAYGFAGRAPEPEFSRLAALAADLLNLPVGLVNLIGAEHAAIVGRAGLDVEQIPRDVAFCSHTILGDDVMVVPDLEKDPRFAGNPLVGGAGGFRFYAGAPLISPTDGQRIGTVCVADQSAHPPLDEREKRLLAGIASLVMDRMEIRRTNNARRDAQAKFERMAAASPDAVVCADHGLRITYWNPSAVRLLGWPATEALGQHLGIIVPPPIRADYLGRLSALVADQTSVARCADMPALRRDGGTFPAQLTVSCWREEGEPAFGVAITDVTARRRARDELRRLAHNDQLTGCANRARLLSLIERSAAGSEPVAMVLLDLDGFKHVNDTVGHTGGDAFLAESAHRLNEALAGRGTLARLGGDEFAVLLSGPGEAARATEVADALQASLKPPFRIAGREFHMGSSAGIALAANPADAGSLLANADLALYKAKAAGGGVHRTFDDRLRDNYVARRNLEDEACRAAFDGQFTLFFQPQVCLQTRAVVGAEALLRWHHPARGLLQPGAFLEALEAGPAAGAVGDWTIIEACRQAALWRSQGRDIRVAVNLFAEQLRAGDLEAKVLDALARWRLPPAALELEVTERIALRHEGRRLAQLHALHARGVSIAFDDFGTGFASLSTLQRCPLNRLKIDRSFVAGLGAGELEGGASRGDIAIIDAVLALGRGLGAGVVAEGVETQAQAAFLAARGCQEGQGYLYGRPVPAARMFEATLGRTAGHAAS